MGVRYQEVSIIIIDERVSERGRVTLSYRIILQPVNRKSGQSEGIICILLKKLSLGVNELTTVPRTSSVK